MKRHWGFVALIVVLTIAAGGCSARPALRPMPVPLAPPLAGEKAYVDTEAAAVTTAAEQMGQMSGLLAGVDTEAAAVTTAASTERMVIRTANLDLIVPNTEKALDDIQAMARELGGYVVSIKAYQYQEGQQATVTFRIPADALEEALERLRAMATTVRQKSVSGQDVTDEYVDLESRLRHLQAKEKQLLEFLDRAEDTEAVLAVYEHLSQTQAEIEQVKGRMQYLENQTALATITVSLTPDVMAQPLATGGWNLPATVRSAVEMLLNVLEFFVKALIYLVIVVLPALILLALPIVGVFLLVRWLVRRQRRK